MPWGRVLEERRWDWDLYTTEAGKVPKDLLEFFVALLEQHRPGRLPPNPPGSVVNAVQVERLRRGINFLLEFGHEAFKDTKRFHWLGPDLYELRSVDKFGNPRWILARFDAERLFVFVHALFKQHNGALTKAERWPAESRQRDLKQRRELERRAASRSAPGKPGAKRGRRKGP